MCRHHSKEELAKFRIGIYTDQPQYFEALKHGLNIEYKTINAERLKQWRGAIDFVHRVKIELLRDYVKDHQGNILYLDTDIVFAKSVQDIFQKIAEGKLYMHIMEDVVHNSENIVFKKLSKFLRNHSTESLKEGLIIPQDVTMWNAGVLGFSTHYSYLLEEVLAFTDLVYPKFPKHVVEQFAFSLYFQITATIFALALLLVLGAFMEDPRLRIPAGSGFLLLFSVMVGLVGAVKYFLKTWELMGWVLIAVFLSLLVKWKIFDLRSIAYGLDYQTSAAQRPVYDYPYLKKLFSPEKYYQDKAAGETRLNRWLRRNSNKASAKIVAVMAFL